MIPTLPNFVVIDTEGNPELREIAILDSVGKVIYHAFSKEHPENQNQRVRLKPLLKILQDFQEIAQNKLVVFHYAKHDLQVLKHSCNKVGIAWKDIQVECSCELAK